VTTTLVRPAIARVADALYVDTRMVTAFLVSRFLVLVAAWVAETFLVRNRNLTSGDGGVLIQSLTAWDGWWYLGVARDGYHAAPLAGEYHDYAFLPLYPAAVRLAGSLSPDHLGLIAVTLSGAMTLLAMALFARLLLVYTTPERASWAASLLVLAPSGAVLSMAYPEALFIAFAVGAFACVERRLAPPAGLLLALAVLTRFQGVVLFLPLAILGYQRGMRGRLGWLLAGPLVGAAYLGFVAVLTGDLGGYGNAQAEWGRVGPLGDAGGTDSLLANLSLPNAVSLVAICAAVFLFVFVRVDRIPLPYVLVPVLMLGSVFASGILESAPRYALSAFPFYWILANRSLKARVAWTIASTTLLFVLAVAYFAGYLVP
jgi:hypothetical protein